MTALPRVVGEWTVDDVDRLPDDGLQYELLDGALLVTPAPTMWHQRAVGRLYQLLLAACPRGFEVFFAPLDWRPDRLTSLQPDVLVVRNDDVRDGDIGAALVLAVEVLSPSTSRKDRTLKRSRYEEAGVSAYWIVDPAEPSFEALDLVDRHYVAAAQVSGTGSARLELPFPVEVVPADLVSPPD
ncbi:Uma2 family endonuclease [Ornithinimicrobium faecis]|uniref:Uma2 family endonuclease n=1 Tax=Ornithinimicrobium faecis TaxID=2934158 RepID=A0ABY4YQR6_9MICO|nr:MULTISPECIES: Uma2 family endonuclease [unclassified Ornithinimicrobium]USQ79049.1 Uma2 family endonuclease [Ornithinimicrobium sp. HY1793]